MVPLYQSGKNLVLQEVEGKVLEEVESNDILDAVKVGMELLRMKLLFRAIGWMLMINRGICCVYSLGTRP